MCVRAYVRVCVCVHSMNMYRVTYSETECPLLSASFHTTHSDVVPRHVNMAGSNRPASTGARPGGGSPPQGMGTLCGSSRMVGCVSVDVCGSVGG